MARRTPCPSCGSQSALGEFKCFKCDYVIPKESEPPTLKLTKTRKLCTVCGVNQPKAGYKTCFHCEIKAQYAIGRQASHPYLLAKKIPQAIANELGFLRTGDNLIIPLSNGSFQVVTANKKRFAGSSSGATVTVSEIAGDTQRVYLAEGIATAISAHIALNQPVVACLSANQLAKHAQQLVDDNPHAEIVVLADNDIGSFIAVDGQKIENPGLHYANKTLQATGGALALPEMGGTKCDWNDYYCQHGAAATAKAIIDSLKPVAKIVRSDGATNGTGATLPDWLEKRATKTIRNWNEALATKAAAAIIANLGKLPKPPTPYVMGKVADYFEQFIGLGAEVDEIAIACSSNGLWNESDQRTYNDSYKAGQIEAQQKYATDGTLLKLLREADKTTWGVVSTAVGIKSREAKKAAKEAITEGMPEHDLDLIRGFCSTEAAQRLRFTKELGWLQWNGTHYEQDADNEVVKAMFAYLETLHQRFAETAAELGTEGEITNPYQPQARKVRTLIDIGLESWLRAKIDDFDNQPDYLNCQNGVVNLRTGELTPHNPTQLFTNCVPVDYQPDVDASDWEQFIIDTFVPEGVDIGSSKEYQQMIGYIQIALGHSLTGRVEDMFFYVQGAGRSGKGTLFQTLQHLLGSYAVSIGFETLATARAGGNQNFDLAPLRNKRMVFASESASAARLNEAMIKRLTGNDPINCAHKYKDSFNFVPKFKIWLASNFDISVDGGDNALWRRVKPLHTPNSRIGREDTSLRDRLLQPEMLRQALSWLIDGSIAWYKFYDIGRPLFEPEIVKRSKEILQAENDTIGAFLADKLSGDGDCPNSTLYNAYQDYCNENGYKPMSQKRLAQELKQRNFEQSKSRVNGKVIRVWRGIGDI